jgi:hypothetical protein
MFYRRRGSDLMGFAWANLGFNLDYDGPICLFIWPTCYQPHGPLA